MKNRWIVFIIIVLILGTCVSLFSICLLNRPSTQYEGNAIRLNKIEFKSGGTSLTRDLCSIDFRNNTFSVKFLSGEEVKKTFSNKVEQDIVAKLENYGFFEELKKDHSVSGLMDGGWWTIDVYYDNDKTFSAQGNTKFPSGDVFKMSSDIFLEEFGYPFFEKYTAN